MNHHRRALTSTLAAVIAVPLLAWLLTEGVVLYEMLSTDTSSRAELGNDLGLGFIWMAVVPLGTILGAAIVWFAVWWRAGRRKATGY